ncbi:MAG: hypothetical protein WCF10_01320 [Polyangiales bacterium]
MLRWLAAILFALCFTACLELPPLPDDGDGGTGGQGGDGGTGGVAGIGGSGGIDPCSVVVPKEASDIEADDGVQSGVAVGYVCANGCTSEDLLDQWSITTCAGKHTVLVTWDNASSDLDVSLLLASNNAVIDEATGPTVCDSMCAVEVSGALEEDVEYLIDVRAVDTNGVPQKYRVEAFPID